MIIGVVGLGLIGGSIALGLKDKHKVIGVDLDENTLMLAKKREICHKVSSCLADLKDAEVVFVAVPINAVGSVVQALSRYNTLIADVGSLKLEFATNLNHFPSYIGTHPMAGKEKGGILSADKALFENALWMVDSTRPKALIEKITPYIEDLGAYTFLMEPDQHDKMVAAVSHLPHLVAVALTLAAEEISSGDDRLFLMAAGGFRDTTRIASGDPFLWQQILTKNPYLNNAAEVFQAVFQKLTHQKDLTPYLERACEVREKLPFRGKGVVGEIFSIVIAVEDKPGAIGDITSILAKEHINIKEIEILRQREGETGPLRLGFATSEKALEAHKLLENLGYLVEARW